MGRRGYPPEFRRKVLDLVAVGRPVVDITRDLGISAQSIYTWRRQDRIDKGFEPDLSSAEKAELTAASTGSRSWRPSWPSTGGPASCSGRWCPTRRYAAIAVMAGEGVPVQLATRVLAVSESGYYDALTRPPSARSIRHAWLTDQIRDMHAASNGTYGARRVPAELTLGRGLVVGHNAVEMLMARAKIRGVTGRPRWRRPRPDLIAKDLVDRDFARSEPNQLWLTDITEHPTREGKVYRAVVLDAYSRRVVGWSIDACPTAALVTNALGMAIESRQPPPGAVIHSDRGVQFGSWAFTDRSRPAGWCRRWAASPTASTTP